MREWIEEISQWLASVKPAPEREAALIDEMTQRLDARYATLLAQGKSAAEAYRITLAELHANRLSAARPLLPPLPNAASNEYETVSLKQRNGNFFGDWWRNLRYSLRMLTTQPSFTLTAVLTLGLGIGATTAIFSVVYAVLYEPMPYPKPDQLMMLWVKSEGDEGRGNVSAGDFLEWKRRNTTFQAMVAWSGRTFNVATTTRPEQIEGSVQTPGFYTMMGERFFMGRDFLPEEGEVGKDRVVILSHKLWREHFGANRDIIGQPIRLNGEPYTVVGILAPGQSDRHPNQMIVPLAFRPEQINHDAHWMLVMGRLKDGVTRDQAQAEMKEIARQLAVEHPNSNAKLTVSVEPLHNNFLPEATIRNLWLLLGAVGFLLLMACVNVANLLLARATTRQREVAIRAALGASRSQLFRQFLTESLVLAMIGGALGIFLSSFFIDAILSFTTTSMLPSEANIRISLPVLLFTVSVTMLAGVLFGTAPAWQASRLDLNDALKLGGRTGTGRRGVRRALVVVEFALALTLLAGGGLALRSFWNLTRVDLGVRTERVLTFFLPVPQSRFAQREMIAPYYRQMLNRIGSVPGVEQVAVTTGVPTRGTGFGMGFTIVGAPPVDPASRPGAGYQMVSPEFFDTFGVRVTKGRKFNEQDTVNAPRVAMINENFAARYFPGQDPIGQRLAIDELVPGTFKIGPPQEWQIVGVFHNVRNGEGLRTDYPEMYVPFWQNPWPEAAMAVRTAGDPNSVIRSITAAVNAIDPDLPLAGVKTMEQQVGEVLATDRFGLVLYGSFAVLALLLAAVGIYGVMAFAVAQRTQEFGVRMALGARGDQILRLVLREGGWLATLGLCFGLGGAYLLGRAMQTTLYNVEALDLGAFGLAAVVLLAAALLACYVPAWRASKVDPLVALRYE